jgi:hypothetical protein
MNSKSEEPQNSEKPEEVIDEIVSRLDGVHEKFVEASASIGYARDALRSARADWERLGNSATTDPEASKLYEANVHFLLSFRDEVRQAQEIAMPAAQLFKNTAGTAVALTSATGSTASFFEGGVAYSTPEVPVFLTPELHNQYAQRFAAFDEALGRTYKEIWEALYGTRADPERAALYLIRQAFDQLFDKLAPDDAVRNSAFWTPKVGDRPDEVWREERIQYAAASHIKDQARSKTVSASSRHMLDVYQALNRAHDRNTINRGKALNALAEMRSILEEWANAVGL